MGASAWKVEQSLFYRFRREIVDDIPIIEIHHEKNNVIASHILDLIGLKGKVFQKMQKYKIPRSRDGCAVCFCRKALFPLRCKDSEVPHEICEKCLDDWMNYCEGKYSCPICRCPHTGNDIQNQVKSFAKQWSSH